MIVKVCVSGYVHVCGEVRWTAEGGFSNYLCLSVSLCFCLFVWVPRRQMLSSLGPGCHGIRFVTIDAVTSRLKTQHHMDQCHICCIKAALKAFHSFPTEKSVTLGERQFPTVQWTLFVLGKDG